MSRHYCAVTHVVQVGTKPDETYRPCVENYRISVCVSTNFPAEKSFSLLGYGLILNPSVPMLLGTESSSTDYRDTH